MTLSLPRSVPTTPVVPDRNATIGLTMAATLLAVAGVAALALRVVEALGSASANELFALAAIALGVGLAVAVGTVAGRGAAPLRPTPGGRPSQETGSR